MWQRIQTLYLAISTILIAVMLFSVRAISVGPDGEALESYRYMSYLPYAVLLVIITLLNVLALTTYKVRVFQYRTAILTAIFTFALQAWLGVEFFYNHNVLVYKVSMIFPLIALILDVLAARGILADQLLVESVNRLRVDKKNRKR